MLGTPDEDRLPAPEMGVWATLAMCAQTGGEFIDGGQFGELRADALRVCALCPVTAPGREYAASVEAYGVWGDHVWVRGRLVR